MNKKEQESHIGEIYGIYKIIGVSKFITSKGNYNYHVECTKCKNKFYKVVSEIENAPKICRHRKNNIFDVWTDRELQEILNKSKSIADFLDNLGLCKSDDNYKAVRKAIEDRKLNLDKFNENNKKFRPKYEIPLEEFFVNGKEISGANLKNKLQKYHLKDINKCECCGISEWNGKLIKMQIHHKDGKHTNNELDNLAILCPNCHSQTDTYAGKNNSNFKEKIEDIEEYIKQKEQKEKEREEKRKAKEQIKQEKEKQKLEEEKEKENWTEAEKKYKSRNKGGRKPTYIFTKEELLKAIHLYNGVKEIAFNYHVGKDRVNRQIKEFELEDELTKARNNRFKKEIILYEINGINLSAGQWASALNTRKTRFTEYAKTHTYEETHSYIENFWKKSL